MVSLPNERLGVCALAHIQAIANAQRVAEEGGHFRRTHLPSGSLVKENVLLNAMNIGFFSAHSVMSESHGCSALLKQLRLGKVTSVRLCCLGIIRARNRVATGKGWDS